jgi:inorganic pyrophosphatase
MSIATKANMRVTFLAATEKNEKESLASAFIMAFRGGCVMGFCLVSIALFFLAVLIMVYMGK